MSPVLLPIYDPPRGEGLFRTTCSPSPFYTANPKPGLIVSSRTNYTEYSGWEAALWSSRTPPATSLVTSSRSAEAAQPRPLNKGFPGCAPQCVEWGCGTGQICCRLRGGRPDCFAAATRKGGRFLAGGRVREGREEGTWRRPQPGRDPELLVVVRTPPTA